MSKLKKAIVFLKKNDILKFIYLNFFSKSIVREKGCYFIPRKNSVIDIQKGAQIYIKGKNIIFGSNKLKKSKAETYLRMDKNSKWIAENGAEIFYNVTIEIKENAELKSKYFSANSGSVIIVAKKICIGEDVMLGRNILVYDSDHHQILDNENKVVNFPEDVVIEDHVWLTSNVSVLKGTTIGKNSIITAQTLVRKSIEENSIAGGMATAQVFGKANTWSRESVNNKNSKQGVISEKP